MIWIFALSLIIICITIFVIIKHGYDFKYLVSTILIIILINILFVPIFNRLQSDTQGTTQFNIPYCPEDNINYYEYSLFWFDNETLVINEFKNHHWSNVRAENIPSGGIFGGTDRIISGECKI